MTPRTAHHLVAVWVALEDCHAEAGPSRYYPGSHKIPQFVFSNDTNHFAVDEMHLWNDYMQA
jgi:ectoine hydroxylase-related dioxygenase (phytanoyl-CoA dioxygenase family)